MAKIFSKQLKLTGELTSRRIFIFYLRPTIDGRTLSYGGQGFSVSYKKSGESEYTDTAIKWIHGGTDPQKHRIAGPFGLENWDRSPVKVNLYYLRDVGKCDPIPQNYQVGETFGKKAWSTSYMFAYYIKDTETPNVRVYFRNYVNSQIASTGGIGDLEWYACGDPDNHIPPKEEATGIFYRKSWGVTNNLGSPPSGYQFDPLEWRQVKNLYNMLTLNEMGSQRETVYNWDTAEYTENQLVVSRNLVYNLKALHVTTWPGKRWSFGWGEYWDIPVWVNPYHNGFPYRSELWTTQGVIDAAVIRYYMLNAASYFADWTREGPARGGIWHPLLHGHTGQYAGSEECDISACLLEDPNPGECQDFGPGFRWGRYNQSLVGNPLFVPTTDLLTIITDAGNPDPSCVGCSYELIQPYKRTLAICYWDSYYCAVDYVICEDLEPTRDPRLHSTELVVAPDNFF